MANNRRIVLRNEEVDQCVYLKYSLGLALVTARFSVGGLTFLPALGNDLTSKLTNRVLQELKDDLKSCAVVLQEGYLKNGDVLSFVTFEIAKEKVRICVYDTKKVDLTLLQRLQALEELSQALDKQKIPHKTRERKTAFGKRIDMIVIELKT